MTHPGLSCPGKPSVRSQLPVVASHVAAYAACCERRVCLRSWLVPSIGRIQASPVYLAERPSPQIKSYRQSSVPRLELTVPEWCALGLVLTVASCSPYSLFGFIPQVGSTVLRVIGVQARRLAHDHDVVIAQLIGHRFIGRLSSSGGRRHSRFRMRYRRELRQH